MAQTPEQHARTAQQEEAENLVSAPPVIVTKSQAKGGFAGIVIGGILGVILGAIIGAVAFEGGFGMTISIVAAGFGGAVAGGVSGGIAKSSDDNLEGPEADI